MRICLFSKKIVNGAQFNIEPSIPSTGNNVVGIFFEQKGDVFCDTIQYIKA